MLAAALATVVLVAAPSAVGEPRDEQRDGADHQALATDVVWVDSGAAGPTVLVVGGAGVDEPGSCLAALEISGWTPTRGRLVVVPRANEIAVALGTDDEPGSHDAAIVELVRQLEPDYVIDLEEGFDFGEVEPRSIGSSIVIDATPSSLARAAAIAASLNASIADEKRRFTLRENVMAGCLARAAHDVLGVPAIVFETATTGQVEAFRARQHRILVATFLTGIGMLEHGPDVLVGTRRNNGDVLVALYSSAGVADTALDRIEEVLGAVDGFAVRRVCASDLRAGVLREFDVVIFPGGNASAQAASIGEGGREAVRRFVDDGGGYLGICAGAYLAANNLSWSLGVLDADVVDPRNWARGEGLVRIEYTNFGSAALSARARESELHYANGPVYARSRDQEIPNFRVLAWYRDEVAKRGVPGGVMPDTPAIVLGRFGAGRVVCCGPHPELTEGMDELVVELVRLAAHE